MGPMKSRLFSPEIRLKRNNSSLSSRISIDSMGRDVRAPDIELVVT